MSPTTVSSTPRTKGSRPRARRSTRRERQAAPSSGARFTLAGANLSGRDLSGAKLAGVDLSGADLSGAKLAGADLAGADLRGARFDDADLSGADLSGADALRASFRGADLTKADLCGARCFLADFAGAELADARLVRADLTKAALRASSLVRADLRDADLSLVEGRDVDLSHARVTGSRWTDARLPGARFRGLDGYRSADWIGVDTRNADFSGALLVRQRIVDQNELAEFRSQGPGHEVAYWLWWATSDCGRSLVRWIASAELLILFFAVVLGLCGLDLGDGPTAVDALYVSTTTFASVGLATDVVDAGTGVKLTLAAEALTGIAMLAGFIAILVSKSTRR